MSALSVTAPFQVFTDIDGSPLDSGYIYIGTVNLDPVANQISVYWDSALTIPAAQPIRTINGYPARAGAPANIFVDAAAYSIRVLNRNAQLCFSLADGALVTGLSGQIPASQVDYTPTGDGAVVRTLQARGQDTVSVKDFGAVGDGVTDDSTAINAAIYYLYKFFGGGDLRFPVGDYLIQNPIFARSSVNWIGEASPGYFAGSLRGVRIKRHSSLATMIYHAGSLYSIRNIEIEGNGGDVSVTATKIFGLPPAGVSLPADDPLRPGVTTYQKGSGLWLYQCTLSNCWYAIHDNTNFGAVNMSECTVRQFITAVVNTSDSRYIDNIFVGSSFAAMSQNVGGIIIRGGLVEFQRKNTDEAAHGFFIQNNASEIQIEGVRFDRNAGHDIIVVDGTKRPHTITINNCYFGRGAWGSDQSVRTSISLDGADGVIIDGCTFMAASSFPSAIQGLISPRAAISHGNCTGLTIGNNNYDRLANRICLTDIALVPGRFQMWPNWVQSGSGTGEWYLTSAHDADHNPWIGEPSYVENEGALLSNAVVATSGARDIGTLNAGEYGWGDNDGLGFDTLYVRVSGDTDPGLGDIYAIYDTGAVISQLNNPSYNLSRSTDIQDQDWKDVYRENLHEGRTTLATGASAAISSNVLSVTVPDGHGVVAGDYVLVRSASGISVTAGVYQVASVTDAGGGNDYININYTAANDPSGTVSIYAVNVVEFTLRTRNRCMYATSASPGTYGSLFGSLSEKLKVVAHGVSPGYRLFSEWPFTVVRSSKTALPAILAGAIIDHNSNLAHNWFATSSDNNMSIDISSDIIGDKLTIRVINTTADDFGYIIGIKR